MERYKMEHYSNFPVKKLAIGINPDFVFPQDFDSDFGGRGLVRPSFVEKEPVVNENRNDRMRYVQFEVLQHVYTLELFYGHPRPYYVFKRDGEVLFEGDDFSPGASTAWDSDDAIMALLRFLTLTPGDTDDEYFENYTQAQMEFAEGDAEYLSFIPYEYEISKQKGQTPPRLNNLDDYEYEDDEDDEYEDDF